MLDNTKVSNVISNILQYPYESTTIFTYLTEKIKTIIPQPKLSKIYLFGALNDYGINDKGYLLVD